VPSGKITIWRVSFMRSMASRTSFFSAVEWPARSTTSIPAFRPCQPNSGTISSSFFITKQASGSRRELAEDVEHRLVLGRDQGVSGRHARGRAPRP
jgi:hypothetical protein